MEPTPAGGGVMQMRLAIVADHRITVEAIRRALRHAPDCDVIGYVDARRPCGLAVANARADVVLLHDPGAPELTLGRIREIRAAAPGSKLILLTSAVDPDWLADAAKAGADAAIAKTQHLESVGVLVREILAGHVYHAFRPRPVAAELEGGVRLLTPRELEILRLVANGAPNSQVAAELWVTEQTVKFHLSNVYQKLGVANRTEASRFAHLNGLLDSWMTTAPFGAEAA
jgi:DNA-binding NarL/FixJ family response regulator